MSMNSIRIVNGTVLMGEPAVPVITDLLIEGNFISDIGDSADGQNAGQVIDAAGKLVLPGLVDLHAHFIAGNPTGFYMLVAAGVTTANDALVGSGTVAEEKVKATPVGLTVSCMYVLKPGLTISGPNPTRAELEESILRGYGEGAFGIKIVGAHFPLEPDATACAIEIAASRGIPLLVHAGHTECRDDFRGMQQIIELADGNPFTLAHVNVYCNGQTLGDERMEAIRAIELLNAHPEIISETTLSELSCMGTRIIDGVPESLCMIDLLKGLGFEPTYQGMLQAIEAGRICVSGPMGHVFGFLDRGEGLKRCRELEGHVTIGYPKHDMVKNILVATGRRANGDFTITAFSTDGGIVPRNVLLEKGLALVDAGVITLPEFVRQASRNGARYLGLGNKGVLSPGFDADIVIADPHSRQAETVISGGNIIFKQGQYYPAPNHFHSLKGIRGEGGD